MGFQMLCHSLAGKSAKNESTVRNHDLAVGCTKVIISSETVLERLPESSSSEDYMGSDSVPGILITGRT